MGKNADAPADVDEDGYPIGRSTVYPGEFTTRPKGSPPPSGPGWTLVWPDQGKNWDTYHRGAPLPEKGKPKVPPLPPAAKTPDPGTAGKPHTVPGPSVATTPPSSRGPQAVQDIEKDFSGAEDPDSFCLPCIIRGLAKGAAIAAAAVLVLALLPEELAAALVAASIAVMVKGIMGLIENWGNMTGHEKQEAVAEIVGGILVGGAGAKWGPKPGSFWPKGGFSAPPVGVTPEGVPMPVPEAGPGGSSDPMQMSGPEDPGGGGGDDGSGPPKRKLSAKERRARDQQRTADEKFEKRGETDTTPRNNQVQNAQFDEFARGLDRTQRQQLHQAITKQGYTPEEIISLRNAMFPDNPYPGPRQ
jgi:hypothetical protein